MSSPPGSWLAPAAMIAHRAAWADLAARALEPNLFSDPAFALPAALHLARRRAPRFLLAWDPGDPRRLIGLCVVAAPLPGIPLSAWLHPQATAAFPLLDAQAALDALGNLLAQTGSRLRPRGLILHGLPADGATMRLMDAHPAWNATPLETRSRAVVRRTPPPPLPGKSGKEFRRQARRLGETGAVACGPVSDTGAAIEAFLRLEAAGWKSRRGTALAQVAGTARFTRDMVAALAADGRCRIDGLDLDGRPIAMGIVLRTGATAFFWKTAFDESYARFSPGAHLAAAIGARQAREPGLALTDSCAAPGHNIIDRLWPERMTVVDVLITPTPPARRHRAALAIERVRRRVRARLKQAWLNLRARKRLPRS